MGIPQTAANIAAAKNRARIDAARGNTTPTSITAVASTPTPAPSSTSSGGFSSAAELNTYEKSRVAANQAYTKSIAPPSPTSESTPTREEFSNVADYNVAQYYSNIGKDYTELRTGGAKDTGKTGVTTTDSIDRQGSEVKDDYESLFKGIFSGSQADAGSQDGVDGGPGTSGTPATINPIIEQSNKLMEYYDEMFEQLETRRKEQEKGIKEEGDEAKRELAYGQEREKGAFGVGLSNIGGYLGGSGSAMGVMASLNRSHTTAITALDGKIQAAISAANIAIDDKQWELGAAKIKEAKDIREIKMEMQQDAFDNELKIAANERAETQAEYDIVKNLSVGQTLNFNGKTYKGIAPIEVDPFFSSSDIMDVMQATPMGETVKIIDPINGLPYYITGVMQDDPNVEMHKSEDVDGNTIFTTYKKDPETGMLTLVSQANIGGGGLSVKDKISIYGNPDIVDPAAFVNALESKQANGTANVPQRNNNPLNLKSGGIGDKYAMRDEDGNVITDYQGHNLYATVEDGFLAGADDLKAKITGGSRWIKGENPTLAVLGATWAEDPRWARGVANLLGVEPSTRTHDIEFNELLDAIATQEGFYAGMDKATLSGEPEVDPFALKPEDEDGKQLGEVGVRNLSDAKFIPDLLSDLKDTFDEMKNKIGWIEGHIPTNERLIAKAEAKVAAQLVGRFMEGGVLRKEDEVKYAEMLPKLTDKNHKVAMAKLQGVKNMLALKYNAYIQDYIGSGYDMSGFPQLDFGEDEETKKRLTGATTANQKDIDYINSLNENE